jgi:hypothetical protein
VNHREAQRLFLSLQDGTLVATEQSELEAHLAQCSDCALAWRQFSAVHSIAGSIAKQSADVPTITDKVMERVARESRLKAIRFRPIWMLQGGFAAAATIVVMIVSMNLSHTASRGSAASHYSSPEYTGGGGGTTFHKADYNDTFVRVEIGNLFALIEGSVGALLLVGFFFLTVVAAVIAWRKRTNTSIAAFWISLFAFLLIFGMRIAVVILFGDEFSRMT